MDMIDAQEAARILGVSDRQIRNYLDSGKLKGKKVNSLFRTSPWLIDRKSVERLKESIERERDK